MSHDLANDRGQRSEGEAGPREGAPGKRTLTSSLPRGDGAAVQRKAGAADDGDGGQAAETAAWMDVVGRPDLHDPPAAAPTSAAPSVQPSVEVKGAAESRAGGKEPVQTEDEKKNYAAATTPVLNDATVPADASGFTTIKMSDVAITASVFDDSGTWKIKVSAASTTIHWAISVGGYTVPNPTDGGNITKDNYKDVIKELKGYEARQASGTWHDPEATRVHELDHVAWFKGEIVRTWPDIEKAILAKSLGASASVKQADAEVQLKAYIDTQRRAWFDAYGVAPEPRAYAAGQKVLDGIVKKIEDYAKSKGWP